MGYDIVSVIPDYLDVFLGVARIEGGLPLSQHLDHTAFDFTLESLHILDTYLDRLHAASASFDPDAYTNVVLAAGIYLGEVIRRLSTAQFQWTNYDDYLVDQPEKAAILVECLGTAALLVTARGRVTLPINKIARYIEEGPENNTHYYASAELRDSLGPTR
jgi:hypothetical protein